MTTKDRKRTRETWSVLQGVMWLVGLAILAWTNTWWPGILLLVALSIAIEALLPNRMSASATSAPQAELPQAPSTPAKSTAPPASSAPEVAEPAHDAREDQLPAVCPKCGGPVAGAEVRWRGTRAAECPFCGATLPIKER
jgi:hypothetical protein